MGIWRSIVVLVFASGLSFQEAPAKPPSVVSDEAKAFLNQGSWFGSVTVELTGNGTRGNESYTLHRSAAVTFKIAAGPGHVALEQSAQKVSDQLNDPKTNELTKQIMGPQLENLRKLANCNHWFSEDFKDPSGTVDLKVEDSKHQGSIETTWVGNSKRTKVAINSFLDVDMLKGVYTLDMGWPGQAEVTRTVTKSKPDTQKMNAVTSHFKLENQPVPKVGEAIHGERPLSKDEMKNFVEYTYGTVEGSVVWHLSPTPLPAVELHVLIPEYQSWLPEPSPSGDNIGPHPLEVDFRLVGNDEMLKLDIHLKEVSWEPGIAGNAPLTPAANEQMGDVVVLEKANIKVLRAHDTGIAVNCGTLFTAWLGTRDGGASCLLTATAYLKTGRIREGKLSFKGLPGVEAIPIPRRTLPSRVADAYKEQYGLQGASDDADDEDSPHGASKGDGLTLFEEYRGFFEDGKFIRGDPTKKDFFVCNKTKDSDIQNGIDLFATASGVVVHGRMTPDEMKSNVINFNNGKVRQVEQHGAMIEGFTNSFVDEKGHPQTLEHAAYTYGPGMHNARTSPKDYLATVISTDVKTRVLPPLTRSTVAKPPKSILAGTVAHELGHWVGMFHHGDPGNENRIWDVAPAAVPGNPQPVTENGKAIRVFKEDGTEYVFKTEGKDRKVRVGVRGGVYSGDEDCLMRYADAAAYIDPGDPNVRILVYLFDAAGDPVLDKSGHPFSDDMPGSSFCTSAKGTGINEAGRKVPRGGSRFGDATMGNCKDQIRISDK